MANMTLAIPDELKAKMETFPTVNWSAVAREAIKQEVEDREIFRKFTSKSTLTEEDALRLGREVNRAVAERHREALASKQS